jgi:glycosyltransferase 2 family protein
MGAQVKDKLKLAAKFGFAIAVIWYMIAKGKLDLAVVKQGFSRLDFMLGSFSLVVFAITLSLFRWKLLLSGQGIQLSMGQVVRYGMIGAFFNTTMPGAVSGDLIKAWYLIQDRKGQKKTPVLTSIVLDRAIGVFGLILVSASPLIFAGAAVWETPQLRTIALPVLGLALGVLAFFGYIMLSVWGPLSYLRKKMEPLGRNRAGEIFLQAYDAWLSYRERPWILVASIFISVVNHLCMVSIVLLGASAIGEEGVTTLQYFLLVPIGLLTTAVPVAPAGLGVGSTHGPELFTMLVTVQIIINLSGILFYLRSPKLQPHSQS